MNLNLKKKSILLVYDNHSHIIQNNLDILSNFNIHSYCSNKYKNQLSHIKEKIEFFKFPLGMLYFILIFKCFKYDYIFITTGPEGANRRTGPIFLLFYFVYIILYGKKTIMGIRDNKKYFLGVHKNFVDKLNNYIRNKTISKIKLLFLKLILI